jgi:hypothetical protein
VKSCDARFVEPVEEEENARGLREEKEEMRKWE